MPKAKLKNLKGEAVPLNFVEQPNDTVILFNSPKGQFVISKSEFERLFEIMPDSVPEQPTQ